MKLKALAIGALTLATFFTGCWQKSVHPFFKPDDVLFDPLLLGAWHEPDKEPKETTHWTFTRPGNDSLYRVEVQDDETRLEFDGHLFKLDDQRFLDLHSRKRSVSEIPAHHLFRVRLAGSALQIQALNIDWIRDWVRTHPEDIAHIVSPDPEHPDNPGKAEAILTAGTDRLQKFVRDHLGADGFLDNMVELKQTKREQPAPQSRP